MRTGEEGEKKRSEMDDLRWKEERRREGEGVSSPRQHCELFLNRD